MQSLLGVPPSHAGEERRTDLQVGDLASQPIRQQPCDTPVVLLQPSVAEVMRSICLQVDFGLFLMPPAIDNRNVVCKLAMLCLCHCSSPGADKP